MDPHAAGLAPAFAPNWSLIAGSIGVGALWLACAACSGAFLSSFTRRARRLGSWLFATGCVSFFVAFGSLATLFARDQFHFSYVFAHAERSSATAYKVAGVWSGQEGSFLLWASCSALFGLLSLRSVGVYRRTYVGVFGLFLAALAGILIYESPFLIAKEAILGGRVFMPPDGVGLVPALRNYWVVIHPPTIFLGFGSLTVLACWAFSAMLIKDPITWVKGVRPWALFCMAILGLGICMGGFWAYETLGWGGFWAWDPVENASFVPWLLVVTFAHGLIVQTTRGRWVASNLLLGGLPFLAFVYGTFLTRSGFLTDVSVHSFAEMNRSALKILVAILGVTGIGFLATWIARGLPLGKALAKPAEPGLHRERAYQAGAVLLSALGLAIALGMSVPLFTSLANQPAKVVGEGLYHLVIAWFLIPILILVALAPFLGWRKTGLRPFLIRVSNLVGTSIGLTGFVYFGIRRAGWDLARSVPAETDFGSIALPFGARMPATPWLMFLVFLCILAVFGNLWRIGESLKRSSPLSFGGFVSHIGLALFLAGMILSRGFEQKQRVLLQPGLPGHALGYQIQFEDFEGRPGVEEMLRDPATRVKFVLEDGRGSSIVARPSLYYAVQGNNEQPVVWPHIERKPFVDIYVALAPPVYAAWEKPESLKPGQSATINGITATYRKMEMRGQPGVAGTKFLAHVELKTPQGIFHVSPGIAVAAKPELANAGPYLVSMLGMDATTKSATIQVFYREPIFPLEIFIKPMTILVWIGAGILTFGGLMAALYRRAPRARAEVADSGSISDSNGKEPDEALATS